MRADQRQPCASFKKSCIFDHITHRTASLIAELSKRQTRQIHRNGGPLRQNSAKKASPSFVGLRPASEASSRFKKSIKSSGTKHEVMLRKALRQLGLHFKCNMESLPGKPDIVFPADKVVVFCDGDFWHGKDWLRLRRNLRANANPTYWISKISSNKTRDHRQTLLLRKGGWKVLRFWESDIVVNPQKIAQRVEETLQRLRSE